jgi:hypothetical protein
MSDPPDPRHAIVLFGGKPGDFSAGELVELADELARRSPEPVSIGVAEQRASGPPPVEILHVALPLLEGYLLGKVIDATLAWARRRWQRRHTEAGDETPPTIVRFEGESAIVFRLDLPDGEPLRTQESPAPRGVRRSPPRWIVGPAAPPPPEDPDLAWVLPVRITDPDAEALREELAAYSFDPRPAAAPPEVAISREDGGPPLETIVRVMIAATEREPEAIAAIGRWSQARREAAGRPYTTAASVIDTTGTVLRRLVIAPAPSARRAPTSAGIAPSVRAALIDLDLVDAEDLEVELWHATTPSAAAAIVAEQMLRCDDNGVAYLSTSADIAELLSATGGRRATLLKLRVPLAVLDISKDWRPTEPRVDFHFLCGAFYAGSVSVVERRDIQTGGGEARDTS